MIARLVPVLLALSLPSRFVLASQWELVPQQSQLNFVASYEGLKVPGRFHRFDVRLRFDPDSVQNSRLDVRVNLASADMDSDDVNEVIVQKEWLHVTHFPVAYFTSTEIISKGGHDFLAQGMLSIKGVQRPIIVPFTWSDAGTRAHMEGGFKVMRTSFNIGTGEWSAGDVIGRDIQVGFSVDLRRSR